MVAAVDVKEIKPVWLQPEVRHVEAEEIAIERQQRLDVLHVEDGMAHAECASAEPEIGRPGLKGCRRKLRPVEGFEWIARGIAERDQLGHMPLIGQRARSARDLDAGVVEPAGKTIELGAGCNLPARHAQAGIAAAVDDQPLLAVVHAEGTHAAAAIDLLHPEQVGSAIWLHWSSCKDLIPK